MSRYTFKCEHFDYSNPFNSDERIASTITQEFRGESLSDILENFEMFLRGSGFHFEGVVDIVEPEGDKPDAWIADVGEKPTSEELAPNNAWAATVNSLMNPPKFRANACEICGLDKKMMERHNCYDDNCPVYAPKQKIAEGLYANKR